MSAAIYVTNSSNRKLSGTRKMDTTYVSINASCPKTCSLKGEGCYAELGYVGITSHRLDKDAEGMTALQAAKAEANAIDQCYGGKEVPNKDLRLHVSGDTRTIEGVKLVNSAIKRWKKRGGNACFSYTHAWNKVPRSKWSNVSILASISSIKEVAAARKQGYAPAMVVESHLSDKTFKIDGSNVKWIPCPAQTKEDVSCSSCRLCTKADWLFSSNHGIAFAAHGARKNFIKRHLNVLK